MGNENKNYLYYKNKPLIRRKDEVLYGSFSDKYIIRMVIKEKKPVNSLMLSKRVAVELKENRKGGRIIKKAERDGIYKAVDLAEYWLNEALTNAK